MYIKLHIINNNNNKINSNLTKQLPSANIPMEQRRINLDVVANMIHLESKEMAYPNRRLVATPRLSITTPVARPNNVKDAPHDP